MQVEGVGTVARLDRRDEKLHLPPSVRASPPPFPPPLALHLHTPLATVNVSRPEVRVSQGVGSDVLGPEVRPGAWAALVTLCRCSLHAPCENVVLRKVHHQFLKASSSTHTHLKPSNSLCILSVRQHAGMEGVGAALGQGVHCEYGAREGRR